MQSEWSVTEAQNELSEVLNRAEHQAQIINSSDKKYVVIRREEYRRLTVHLPATANFEANLQSCDGPLSLKELILQGPSLECLDLERDKSSSREVEI